MIAPVRISVERGALTVSREAPRMTVERTPPSLEVRVRPPQVSYDRSDYREAVGVLSADALGRRIAARAEAMTAEAIATIAGEGDTLARIEDGGTIATIARGKLPQDEAELTLSAVPPPVRTVLDPGGIGMTARPGTLRIRAELTPVAIENRPSRVTVDTEVPPRIDVAA